jgi:transcriptional regulator with XRE-family HTH domain
MMVRIRLKEILQEKDISMSKLSRMSDISFSTISRIINDKNYSPTLSTLERIARALDIPISDLYEETEK